MRFIRIGFTSALLLAVNLAYAQVPKDIAKYNQLIKKHVYGDYKGMFHRAGGVFPYPFITPGSTYSDDLWDWDSWLSNIALRQILADQGTAQDKKDAVDYEQGCIKNFLTYCTPSGYMPIVIWNNADPLKNLPEDINKTNMHKPVLAQHAAFLTRQNQDDAGWIAAQFNQLKAFIGNYKTNHRHLATGLYYWQDDLAIGVDNDPATFFRPKGSSGSIYLNCLMYKELTAMAYLAKCQRLTEDQQAYEKDAAELKAAIQKYCWDNKDGFYYSVDLNLLPIDLTPKKHLGITLSLHKGHPRNYDCLIQRLGVWTGFMAMWADIATPAQVKRMVRYNYADTSTFNAPYGIRSLSKQEKMYDMYAGGNPSNWLGPIWLISNYMTFKGLVKYGYQKEARELAYRSIRLLGQDVAKTNTLHEYYQPETGKPIFNAGFKSWNYLIMNMIAWTEGRSAITEF